MTQVYWQDRLLGHLPEELRRYHSGRRPYLTVAIRQPVRIGPLSDGRIPCPDIEVITLLVEHRGYLVLEAADVGRLRRIPDFAPEDAALPLLMEKAHGKT